MQKIIEIEEGRSFNFKASAFSPIMYNKLFPEGISEGYGMPERKER